MFSASEIRSITAGFGRFLAQLGGLALLGFTVWAALYTAAVWNSATPRSLAAASTKY